MNETPRFDSSRSDAIRAMLVETVEQNPAVRRRQRRFAVAVVATALVGGLGAGGTALALSGVSLFPNTPPSAPVTITPTPSPTPTPTTPPNPLTAPVRVPLTCNTLLPESTAESLVGADLGPSASTGSDPLSYADQRVGALTCQWSSAEEQAPGTFTPMVSLTIVPNVSAENYQATSQGIDIGGSPPVPGFGTESRESCTLGSSFPLCTLVDLVGDYGVRLTMVPASQNLSEDAVSTTREIFAIAADAVSAAGAPGPLWEPTGANLVGVSSCDGLITNKQLGEIVGDPTTSNYRTAEGEFSIATFRSNDQVGGFACGWTTQDAGIWASVLPGGAAYFSSGSSPLGGGSWTPTTGYPGKAFVSSAGDQVSVLIDNAWFLVRVPAGQIDHLPQIVTVVVQNVTAAD